MCESFADLFEESLSLTEMTPGALINSIVIDVNDDYVTVSAGLKSEGIIPVEQFKSPTGELSVQLGDVVEVALESVEDGFGETKLSREKARRSRAWEALQEAYDDEEIISGILTGKVKGGFTVELGAIRAFLPGSLVDVRPVHDPSYLEGKELEFKLIKLDQRRNNVVVSRRAVVEEEYSAEREQLLENLEEGQSVKGIVKNLTDYGAFIDLGGVDGLLHITDMAWKRVRHPSEVVQIGEEIDIKVLKFDKERSRVSLGLKQLGEDPWQDLIRRYPVNTHLFGKVSNLTDYGCFVEIEDGVEGLVHVSEMDWTNKNVNPAKVVTLAEEVEIMILDIDADRRRISLGMKQCQANPWDDFAKTNNKGDKVKGQIKSITDFGVFIGLDGGIDGLVHLSDISWSLPGEEAIRDYKKGDEVEAIVLAVDPERERISLGIKQMGQDPFSNYVASNPKGSSVKGTVIEVTPKMAKVDLGDEVVGILRVSELSTDRIDDASTVLSVGQEIEAKLMGVDRKTHAINLSIKSKVYDEHNKAVAEYSKSDDSATTSLGDIFKEQMSD
ncbi:MAG: 30S ribosomal protein S1 [Thiotrichaceae bacterium]|nr:30S ribosomal protein S1 [Thiotrichaceae bacterium]